MGTVKAIPIFNSEDERVDFILDLFNGNKENKVLTKNSDDSDERSFEWLHVSEGIVACFILKQIDIKSYYKI